MALGKKIVMFLTLRLRFKYCGSTTGHQPSTQLQIMGNSGSQHRTNISMIDKVHQSYN